MSAFSHAFSKGIEMLVGNLIFKAQKSSPKSNGIYSHIMKCHKLPSKKLTYPLGR